MKTRFLPGILAIVATGIVACGDDGSSVSSNYNNGDPGSEAGTNCNKSQGANCKKFALYISPLVTSA